ECLPGGRESETAQSSSGSKMKTSTPPVRLDLVVAQERNDAAAGDPLDGADRVVPERALEQVAHMPDRVVPALPLQRLLGRRHRVLEDGDHDVIVDVGAREVRAAPDVLLVDVSELAGDLPRHVAAGARLWLYGVRPRHRKSHGPARGRSCTDEPLPAGVRRVAIGGLTAS